MGEALHCNGIAIVDQVSDCFSQRYEFRHRCSRAMKT
jgi:hypothetical protein